jgi:uncharacterized protein YndB with AHSA1/START domain
MCNQTLQEVDMEFGTIEREVYVEASPEIVFEVVSSPDHLTQWWPDGATHDSVSFGSDAGRTVTGFAVVDARPPHQFSFRWTQPVGSPAAEGNSLLVTFDLVPKGGGTLLKMTESGFREMGWEAAVLEQQYNEHSKGWDFYLPRLAPYAESLARQ